MSGQPVILCGKTEQIATGVIATLKPEYDVIHLILTPEGGVAQIPLLLSGKEAPSDSTLGSKNYSQTPIAVLTGAGYDDEAVAAMKKACEGEGIKKVPWLRPDMTKPAPPLGPEYGKALVARIKELLADLKEKNQLENNDDTLWY